MRGARKSVRMLWLLVALLAALMVAMPAWAADTAKIEDVMEDVGGYLYKTVDEPQISTIGGEWAVLGLVRSGYDVPQSYYDAYYDTVVEYVKAHDGVLHDRKYSEYSRVVIALSAIGRDARDVGGYDLTEPLGDYDKTIWQGLNGPIWALIALDSADYPMPQNAAAATQATRQMYVDLLLASQLTDGGWSLLSVGGKNAAAAADADITGMALTALANYQDQPKVKAAVDKALECLSAKQAADGGFGTMGIDNVESCAQVIVALAALDVELDDARFVKNGNSLMDCLLTYHIDGKGMQHTKDNASSNLMATEQGYYALTAAWRAANGMADLYDMSDVDAGQTDEPEVSQPAQPDKSGDVKKTEIVNEGMTFGDVSEHPNRAAVEALAARGIITGDVAKDGTYAFRPNDTMTRAEFAAIVVRALGLEPEARGVFSDIKPGAWYAAYIDTANAYGIVNGTSATTFAPDSKITRQDAAVMVARAAGLCGLENKYNFYTGIELLNQFEDYYKVAEYGSAPLAFCYDEEIWEIEGLIEPNRAILRCEIAQMLYNLLEKAELL